jgi:hypothetical protein
LYQGTSTTPMFLVGRDVVELHARHRRVHARAEVAHDIENWFAITAAVMPGARAAASCTSSGRRPPTRFTTSPLSAMARVRSGAWVGHVQRAAARCDDSGTERRDGASGGAD